MDKNHVRLSLFILILSIVLFYWFDGKVTETTSQNLVTFFSIVFGFYMTSIAILYNASFTKSLYKDKKFDKNGKRGIDRLKEYFRNSGYWSIISIGLVILYTIFSTKNENSVLNFMFDPINIPFVGMTFDINLGLSSVVLGISVVNTFFMLLILHTVLDGMVEESKSG